MELDLLVENTISFQKISRCKANKRKAAQLYEVLF